MRVLVCGGRNYSGDVSKVLGALDPRPTVIIHGGASGADSLADRWAMIENIERERYYANWKLGPKAGPIRNGTMLKEGKPDLVVAFPGGRGTADMVHQARLAGVQVIEVAAMGVQDR